MSRPANDNAPDWQIGGGPIRILACALMVAVLVLVPAVHVIMGGF